jgi:hypothetical protein
MRQAQREVRNFGLAAVMALAVCVGFGAASVGVIEVAVNGRA